MSKVWANPVWFFFHGMAEKVHEDFFLANKGACLNIVKTICGALPCPMCRKAATKYMSNVGESYIPSKEHFKKMLFDFHNHVNKKLRKKQFTRKELSIYKRLQFIRCTKLMCYQVRRFNRGRFRSPSAGGLNHFVDRVEVAVTKHKNYFI